MLERRVIMTSVAERWTIDPALGVGPIRFGMTAEEVDSLLGEPVDRAVGPTVLEHTYGNGVRVLWSSGVLDYVELILGSDDVAWELRGVELTEDRASTSRRLAEIGLELADESDRGGYYLRIFGEPVVFWLDDIRSNDLGTAIVYARDDDAASPSA